MFWLENLFEIPEYSDVLFVKHFTMESACEILCLVEKDELSVSALRNTNLRLSIYKLICENTVN